MGVAFDYRILARKQKIFSFRKHLAICNIEEYRQSVKVTLGHLMSTASICDNNKWERIDQNQGKVQEFQNKSIGVDKYVCRYTRYICMLHIDMCMYV